MAMTKDQVLAEAMALSVSERYELVADLTQSLAPDEFTPDELAEIRRRIDASNRGEGTLTSVDDAVATLREKLQTIRRRRAS
jgi:putative addiction module component (TIGR02574 family)